MSRDGIYLDDDFSKALIASGYAERIITSPVGPTPYIKGFMSEYSTKQEYKQIALEKLVLHERVFLYPYFDDFDVSGLASQGAVEVPDLGPRRGSKEVFTANEVRAAGLLFPALTLLHTEGIAIASDELNEILDSGDLEDFSGLQIECHKLELARRLGTASQAAIARLSFVEQELNRLRPIQDALSRVSKLIEASKSLGVQALWNCTIPASEAEVRIPTDDYYTVAGVCFRGLKRIRVNTLHDALDLRNHPDIQHLRAEIADMTQLLRTGQVSEQDVMKRINKANRILEALELAGNAGTVITILGLPTLVLQGLGTLLIANVGLLSADQSTRQDWNWALVSNVSPP